VLPFISNKILFYLLFLFIIPFISFSQVKQQSTAHDNFPFHHIEYINAAQGLNGSEVSWMIQDKRGFLWVMTDLALNRFDGYSFRSFPYNINSLSTGWMTEDKNGTLWMPSRNRGLYSFDPYKETFTEYHHQPGNINSLYDNRITAMTIGRDSIVWIASPGDSASGLDKFDLKKKSFTHFTSHDIDSIGLPVHFVFSLVVDKHKKPDGRQDYLWIINTTGLNDNTGIDCFDTKTNKIISHYDFPFPSRLAQNAIKIDGIKNETIWIGSDDNGIYGFNTISRKFMLRRPGHPCHSTDGHISDKAYSNYYPVMEDHAGNLWTTNDDNEIVYYDRKMDQFYFKPIPKKQAKFFKGSSSLIFEDRNQKVWFGTDNGLIAIDAIKQKEIFICQHDDNDPKSISGNFIWGIHRVKDGPLFVGANSLDSFDKKTKSFFRFPLFDDGKKISTTQAWDFYEDSKNNIWFTGGFGLASYNRTTKKNRLYNLYSDDGPEKSVECIGIIEDKKGRFWTPCWNVGLYSLDPATGKIRIFNPKDADDSLTSDQLATIFEDSRGILYTCGWEGGFITFNPDSEKFKIYHHDPKDPFSVSNETAHMFHETKNGLIWFATIGGGINVFNPATKKFKAFTIRDGLVHDNVSSLIEDKNGNYWAGTRGGISCFALPDDPFAPGCKIKFRNYDISDGLPSNDCNMSSAFCGTDGTLYFGTRGQGLFYFHPDSLKDNDFIPPVYITEFRLKNKLVNINDSNSVLKSPIEFTKEIRLNYKQNIISFSFAALNYVRPEKNQYAYMLEGYDKDWIYTDASKRFATYTNLDPKKYTFKVKASNNDGIWNDAPTELKIIITPPFWQTTWFRILMIATIAGILYLIYRYRMQQVLKLQQIRNRIAADLHDDIGSTLNSISVYSEVAKKDPSRANHALTMIGESSRKIIDSLSDIVWTINPQNDSFDKIIFRMRSLTHNILKAKKIDCTFKSDEGLDKINMPMEIRRNFYLIFKEALNNLVKYSGSTRASVLVSCENKNVTFIIRDNGIGFDSSSTFNGNGINNMKRRAAEINAKLNIESIPGSGTSIELNLKV
jgi:ligand-binding sensor domain-containing protein/two-component sensor histidine kinase